MRSEREFIGANILKAIVETNCPQGGDSGHGGVTTFELVDLASTDLAIEKTEKGFIIKMRGDSECGTLIDALKFAACELEFQWGVNDRKRKEGQA